MLTATRRQVRVPAARPPAGLPSVCFVAPNAYAALSGRHDVAHIGGAERQQVLLARELVRRGHRVSFVVLDHGQPDGERTPEGIAIFTCYRLDGGLPLARFFHPRLHGLWGAMRRADADVYYQRGAEAETGFVGHWCRRHGRVFVFAAAHDTNCLVRSPLIARRSERMLFRYGLRRADAVVTQTSLQRALLLAELGVPSAVVRSCIASDWNAAAARPDAGSAVGRRILWVGRFSEEKRPHWVVALARELPGCRFDVIGEGASRSALARRVARDLSSLANVRWHGYVPHHEVLARYREADVVLCTSESEGFPNVFLEAWACATGVLSTVDPDGVIALFETGAVATGYDDLRRHLAAMGERRAFWEQAGARGLDYVRRHHHVEGAGQALAAVIDAAWTRARGARRTAC